MAKPGRIEREKRTIYAMLRIYCRLQHGRQTGLCRQCKQLLRYAWKRLERCPYGEQKPSCEKCPIHCYQPARRQQMRQVMRLAGPRMLWRHPIWTLWHFWDNWQSHTATAERKRARRNITGVAEQTDMRDLQETS